MCVCVCVLTCVWKGEGGSQGRTVECVCMSVCVFARVCRKGKEVAMAHCEVCVCEQRRC